MIHSHLKDKGLGELVKYDPRRHINKHIEGKRITTVLNVNFSVGLQKYVNCQFDKKLVITIDKFPQNPIFEGCVFLGPVEVNSNSKGLIFSNCVIEDALQTNYSNCKEPIIIKEKSLVSNISIKGIATNLIIKYSSVASIISNDGGSIGNLNISNSLIDLIDLNYCASIELKDTILKNKLSLTGSESISLNKINDGDRYYPEISINDCARSIQIIVAYLGETFISNSHYLTLKQIHNNDVLNLAFINSAKHILIEDSLFHNIEIHAVQTSKEGQFELKNSRIGNILQILESNLGKASFKLVQLRFAKVKLLDVNLEEWDFEQVEWPKGHEIELSDSKKVISSSIQTREFFRILKQSSRAKGDDINANYFRANELEQHYKLIKEESADFIREKGRFKFLKDDLFSELFILWTNKIFSGFGGNVWRPMVIGGVVHLVLFNLFLVGHDGFGFAPFFFDPKNTSLDYSFNGIVKYLEMFNPLHKIENYVEVSEWSKFIDIVMRLCSGYFIYYILRASRKFSR